MTRLIRKWNDSFTFDTSHSKLEKDPFLNPGWVDVLLNIQRSVCCNVSQQRVLQCIATTCVVVPWICRAQTYMHAHGTNKRKDMCTSACRLQKKNLYVKPFESCSVLWCLAACCSQCVEASTPPFFACNHTILNTHGTLDPIQSWSLLFRKSRSPIKRWGRLTTHEPSFQGSWVL